MATRKIRTNIGVSEKISWFVIDVHALGHLIAAGQKEGILPEHDGYCLQQLRDTVIVGRAYEAVSQSQARLFAANGGHVRGLNVIKRTHGQPYRFFRDVSVYAVVEKVVLQEIYSLEIIPWDDLDQVREALYMRHGAGFLANLCQGFIPREHQWRLAREPGSDGSEDGPFDLWANPDNFPYSVFDHEETIVRKPHQYSLPL